MTKVCLCGEPLGPEWMAAKFCSEGCEWHSQHDGPIGPDHPGYHVLHNGNIERPFAVGADRSVKL